MMKRATLLLAGLLAASMFAFVACDDEPTQEEANQEFCDDTAELIASLARDPGPRQGLHDRRNR